MAAYTVPTIAITGSPKDYTGLVAARRRQKEADEAKAEEARRKKDEEIYKATTVKNGEYLPMRIPDVLRKKSEIVNRMLEASQNGDFNANDAAKTEWEAYLQNLKGEKLQADEAIKGTEKGSHLSTGNLRALYTAQGTDSKEIQDLVKSGDVVIEEGTGRLVPNTIPNTDFRNVWTGLASNYKNKHTGELKTAEDGTQFFELSYDLPGLQAGLNATYVNDPNIRKKAELVYRQNNDTTGMSPETIAQKAKEDFIANGLEFGSEGQWQRKPSGKGLTVNVNTGNFGDKGTPFGGFPDVTNTVMTNPITKAKETYKTKNYFGYNVGDVTITSPVPGGAVYVDSGEPVNDADVRTAKFNQFLGKVLFKKDYEFNGIKYPKGSSVPMEIENEVINAGLGEAGVVAMGLANGQSIQYDAKGLNSSLFAASTEKEKEGVVKEIEKAKQDKRALQAKIDKQYMEAKRKASDGSPKPKPEPKPTPESTNKRVNSNPALQKLLNQNAK